MILEPIYTTNMDTAISKKGNTLNFLSHCKGNTLNRQVNTLNFFNDFSFLIKNYLKSFFVITISQLVQLISISKNSVDCYYF